MRKMDAASVLPVLVGALAPEGDGGLARRDPRVRTAVVKALQDDVTNSLHEDAVASCVRELIASEAFEDEQDCAAKCRAEDAAAVPPSAAPHLPSEMADGESRRFGECRAVCRRELAY